jgi:hypothetical protein
MTQITKTHAKQDFDSLLIWAVNEALAELGESTRETIYFQIERNYSLKKDDIPRNFDRLILALRHEFGVGSKTIEALILEKLFGKMGSSNNEFQTAAATMILLSQEFKQNMENAHADS